MLTLEDKFEAIQQLGPAYLTLSRRFSWIVLQDDVYRIHPDGEGEALQGRGVNPYEAIHHHFDLLTMDRVVLYARHPESRLVRWNLDHWTSVSAKKHFVPEDRDEKS